MISFWVEFQFSDLEDFSVIGTTVTLGVYGCRAYVVDINGSPIDGGGSWLSETTGQRLKFILECYQLSRYAEVDAPPDAQDMGDFLDWMDARRTYNYYRISDSNCLAFTEFAGRFVLPRPSPCVLASTIEPEPNDDDATDSVTITLLESALYEGA